MSPSSHNTYLIDTLLESSGHKVEQDKRKEETLSAGLQPFPE